jgi:hypothetical protein
MRWAGSALLIYSLMQARVLRFRVLNLLACLVLVIFNALLGIWPMVVMNVVLSGINVWFIRGLTSQRHSGLAFEVLEVGPLDEYLRHTACMPPTSKGSSPGSCGTVRPPGTRHTWSSTEPRRLAWCSFVMPAAVSPRSSSTT